MDKVKTIKAIKELEHFSSLLIEGKESEVSNIYTIEFLDAIKDAVEALEYMRNMGKCEGCVSSECEMCIRDPYRHDMYSERY